MAELAATREVPALRLILASLSPYRRVLLERLGCPFEVQAPRVDEEELKRAHGQLYPAGLACALARAKAASVADMEPDALVIGSDQLLAWRGQVFGKPGTPELAVAQLEQLAGERHELITAVALVRGNDVLDEHCDIATLAMRHLSRAELERYVEADRPVDCAGSYKLEARGITLFDRVEAADQTAITGLPLIALTTMLRNQGMAIP